VWSTFLYSFEPADTVETADTYRYTAEMHTDMRLIAHRGFASINPENTLSAIERASAIADEVEVDVRRCASGELVVVHDPTVDRVTDENGAVSEYTRSDLESMRVLDTEEGIPTLADLLRIVPDRVGINVELKEPDIAADAIDLVSSFHPNSIVSSFYSETLSECHAIDPDVPTAYITDESGTDGVETAVELDCEYLHLGAETCTERAVGAAHSVGIHVNAWTIDSAEEATTLASTGVDGVIADRPDVL